MLNLNHLHYFWVASGSRTITNAAKILGISQPSLSSQLKLLESQMDISLFRRSGRNVYLTAEGERLRKLCRPIFESILDLERKMKLKNTGSDLHLRIGFTEQIEGVFVEELVSQILIFKKWPVRPKITVISGRKEELVAKLKAHELDLAFSNSKTSDAEIVALDHFKMPVGAYVSKKSKLKKPEFTLKDFLTHGSLGFALPHFQLKLRHEIEDYLSSHQVKNRVSFESDTLALVTRAVIDDVGLGFFPRAYLQDEEKLKRVVCISGPTPLWFHSLYVFSHLRFEQTPAIKEMILAIRKHFSIVEHSKSAK